MTERVLVESIVGLLAGTVLGGVFFGGLLATVRALPTAGHPGLLAAASLLGRLALVAGGILVLARIGLVAVTAATLAVIGVRTVLVRRVVTASADDGGGG